MANLENIQGIRLFFESDYSKAVHIISTSHADAVLIEIAETGEYDASYCLALCAGLQTGSCKLLLLCPEQDEPDVAAVVDAKQKGVIEDFVFYDASIDYLVSKLLAI